MHAPYLTGPTTCKARHGKAAGACGLAGDGRAAIHPWLIVTPDIAIRTQSDQCTVL